MAVGEVVTDFNPVEEGQIITGFQPIQEDIGLIPSHKLYQPEPPPFKIDEFVNDWQKTRTMDEDPPQEDIANVFDTITRPVRVQGYLAAGALNRGLGLFVTHLEEISSYLWKKQEQFTGAIRVTDIGKETEKDIREKIDKWTTNLFKNMAENYDNNADYWQRRANSVGINFIDELMGEAVGGAPTGIAEFILNIPYAAMLGAAEAEKKGENEIAGAITEGAKRGILGLIFKTIDPLKQYLRAPIMGTVFGIQAVSEGAEPKEIAKAAGTGAIYSLTSPGGRMGLNEIRENLRIEIPKIEAKIKGKKIVEPEMPPTAQHIELEPEKYAGIKVAVKSEDKVYVARPTEATHPEIIINNGLDVEKVIPGFVTKEGKFLEQYPKEESLRLLRQEQLAKEQRGSIQVGKQPLPPSFIFSDPKIEQSYQESVPKKESFYSKTGEYFTDMWHKITRPYEYLPRNKEFAQLQFDLDKLKKQKGVASYNAVMEISKTLSELKGEDYNLFTRKVILDDLVREAERGHDLPWGFDKDTIRMERDRINVIVEQAPVIRDALIKRKAMWNTVKDEYTKTMEEIGFDVSDRLKNEDYFRHQVLEYVNLKGLFGAGKKLKTPVGRGFLKARKGSELDINRDFIQPEYEVISQMLYDIQVAKTIKDIDKNYNIAEKIKKDAKAKKLENWHEAIPEGYVIWQPREGNVFYMTDSIPAKLAEKLHSGALEELGITKDDLRSALAMGRKRKEFVVKEEVAKTLDELVRTKTSSVIGDADKALMRGIKAWFLFAPRRYLKYEARNTTGDSDAAFIGNPSGFLKTPQATKELGNVLFWKKEITGELKEFFERGGFDSTLFAQEMGDLQSLWTFERLYKQENPGIAEVPYRIWKKYWKTIRITNTFRETILRYGNYLDYLEQMEKNPEGRPDNFGGSKREEVMGLQDIRDRAYMLQNDLLGPYDRISVMGQHIREYWYPFWSWKELNFKRYVQFAKNAAEDGKLAQMAGKKMLGTIAHTPFMAYKVGKFLISATAFWSALQVWNNIMFPEEEGDLAENIKSQPHIIFGKDSEGNILYFNRIGALGDFLEWFGLDSSPQDVSKWFKGEKTLKEIAIDMVQSPINVIVQGVTPQVKVPAEVITGRTLFPDVFKPGTIRDRGFYLSRVLGLENEYKEIAGLPSKGYAESLKNFFIYTADPGQGAYSDIQEAKRRWLKEQGKGAEGFWLTPKGNALYNLKLAIKYKDEKATNKYMYEYFSLGGNAKGIEESLDRMHPLAGLSKRDRTLFEQSLSSDQVKRLEKAMIFFHGTLKGGTR